MKEQKNIPLELKNLVKDFNLKCDEFQHRRLKSMLDVVTHYNELLNKDDTNDVDKDYIDYYLECIVNHNKRVDNLYANFLEIKMRIEKSGFTLSDFDIIDPERYRFRPDRSSEI